MKPRLLVLAKTLPLHDRASGDYRLFRLLELFTESFDVDFLSTTHLARNSSGKIEYPPRDGNFSGLKVLDRKYLEDLRSIQVNPLNEAEPLPLTIRPGNRYNIRPFLEAKSYDLIWVEFYYLAAEYIAEIRRFQPQAKVICDSVDLHFRRLARQCNFFEAGAYSVNVRQERGKIRKSWLRSERRHADHVRDLELEAYRKCDSVVLVSDDDREELLRLSPQTSTFLVPNVHRPVALRESPGFEKRKGCVFVGNFDHEPNLRSVIFLKHEVAPLLENTSFTIVGSNPPKVVQSITELGPRPELFKVTGYVEDTRPYLDQARVSVAPILYGAGMNGKIGEALSAGLPVVTTSLGALGMQLEHEKTCLIADDPAAFAAAILRLQSEETLWNELRENGLRHVKAICGEDKLSTVIQEIARTAPPRKTHRLPGAKPELRLPPPAFPKPPKHPLFSVVLLTHNRWSHTELCLRTLAYAEKRHPGLAEYILVDNSSSDATPLRAGKIKGLKLLAQQENLGYAAGNNLGIEAARGKNVILLNNDTLVPPHWLCRFAHYTSSIPNLGVLGPSTNTESGQNHPGVSYGSLREFFEFNEQLPEGAWQRAEKISGLCMLLTREALKALGPLDTSFGRGYFEDDDYCLRAEDAGFALVWAQDVFVHHFGSASFGKTRRKFLEEGMARFAFKWGKRGLEHIANRHKETLLHLGKS